MKPSRERRISLALAGTALFVLAALLQVRLQAAFRLQSPLPEPETACFNQTLDGFTLALFGYVTQPDGTTTLTWRVTNVNKKDISYVAFGTGGWTPVAPADDVVIPGALGDYRVEWTNEHGNPGFASIKYAAEFDGFSQGAEDIFAMTVSSFDPSEPIQVQMKAGQNRTTFSVMFDGPGCDRSPAPESPLPPPELPGEMTTYELMESSGLASAAEVTIPLDRTYLDPPPLVAAVTSAAVAEPMMTSIAQQLYLPIIFVPGIQITYGPVGIGDAWQNWDIIQLNNLTDVPYNQVNGVLDNQYGMNLDSLDFDWHYNWLFTHGDSFAYTNNQRYFGNESELVNSTPSTAVPVDAPAYWQWDELDVGDSASPPPYVRMIWCTLDAQHLGTGETPIRNTVADVARRDYEHGLRGRVWFVLNEPDLGGCGDAPVEGTIEVEDPENPGETITETYTGTVQLNPDITAYYINNVIDAIKENDPSARLFIGGPVFLSSPADPDDPQPDEQITRSWWIIFINTLKSTRVLYQGGVERTENYLDKIDGVHLHLYPFHSTSNSNTCVNG
ncbi:MAG: hypothetical protein KDD92_16115 [Caldilineaceae bacterium]|nr:hypothetical protein [Caldilineaceae bacterium]